MDCSPPGTSVHGILQARDYSRQEYEIGLPCSPPGDLPDPGIGPTFLTSLALAGRFFTSSAPWEAPIDTIMRIQFAKTSEAKYVLH